MYAMMFVDPHTGSMVIASAYVALAEVARQDRLPALIADLHGDTRVRAHLVTYPCTASRAEYTDTYMTKEEA